MVVRPAIDADDAEVGRRVHIGTKGLQESLHDDQEVSSAMSSQTNLEPGVVRVVAEETGHTKLEVLVDSRGERNVVECLHTCWDGPVGTRRVYVTRYKFGRRKDSRSSAFGASRRGSSKGYREPARLNRDQATLMGTTHEIVGWTRSTCPCREPGREYCKVRTVSAPVAACLKRLKVVLNNSLALATGTLTLSQSPAEEMDVAVRLFSASHELTAATVSDLGATKLST